MLPVFRATGVAWAAPTYPVQAMRFRSRVDAAAYVADETYTGIVGGSAAAAARTAVRTLYQTANHVAATAARAADFAGLAFTDLGFVRTGIATGTISARFADPFWSAISIDATRVEEGATASDIAGSQLWPQHLLGPEAVQSLWQEMKAELHAAGQDWQVWTIWYDDRLDGRVRNEKRELAYVLIEDDLWKQGPAIVNAEIKRRIEEFEPPPQVVELSAVSVTTASGLGVPSINVAEPPPIEAIPEQEPIATGFEVNSQGVIDRVPNRPAIDTAPPGTAMMSFASSHRCSLI